MTEITIATHDDLGDVIELERRLFVEDSGSYEPFADTGWPDREGAADYERLLDDPHGIVFVARDDGNVVGVLMGFSAVAASTRQPILYGVLRSMYVAETHRRLGLASRLTHRFITWARAEGCVEAQVNHYAKNTGAGQLYEACGFQPHSLNRVLLLDR